MKRKTNHNTGKESFVVVSWPESQELCLYENYTDYCTFIMGDGLESMSYLVNKGWYSRLQNGELQKNEEFEPCEDF